LNPPSPTLHEATDLIRSLGDPAVAKQSPAQVRVLVQRLIEDHPFVTSTNLGPQVQFWRGRKAESADGFENVNMMIQPPPDACSGYNRCSPPREPMFYAALSAHTVFSEVHATVGDRVQLVLVAPEDGCQIKLAHIGEIDHWRRYGRSILAQPQVEEILRLTFPNDDWSEREVRRMYVDAFMADMFSRDGRALGVYEVTSAISRCYLEAGIDGLIYPSVKHRGGLCVALHTRCAQQMGVVEFALFEIEADLGYGLYKKQFLKDAASWNDDGTILWNPPR